MNAHLSVHRCVSISADVRQYDGSYWIDMGFNTQEDTFDVTVHFNSAHEAKIYSAAIEAANRKLVELKSQEEAHAEHDNCAA